MKKFLAVALAMVFALTACVGGNGGGTGNNSEGSLAAVALGGEISGSITVSTFDSMLTGPFLEEAARLFMDQHPGTYITVESFSSMPEIRAVEGGGGGGGARMVNVAGGGINPQERRDYIHFINTELMGGRGPDILAMDVLPFHRYARGGQLVNLAPLMEQDPSFNINDYRTNIFDALTMDTGLFMFPIDYNFNYITFDTRTASLPTGGTITHDQMFEAGRQARANMDEPLPVIAQQAGPRPGLFFDMFMLNLPQFVDFEERNANFNDGSFVQMLETILEHEAEELLIPRITPGEGGGGMMRRLGAQSVFSQRASMQLLNEFHEGTGIMGAQARQMMGISEYDEIAGLLSNNAGDVPFTIGNAFGINSNTPNLALAWEFIKFLSSDAVSQTMRLRGLPTHIGAFEERAEMQITGELMGAVTFQFGGGGGGAVGGAVAGGGAGGGGGARMAGVSPEDMQAMLDAFNEEREEREQSDGEITPEQATALAEYKAAVEHFTGLLNTFHFADSQLEDLVLNEVREFFDGNRSAQQVAETLQSRVTLFLNE